MKFNIPRLKRIAKAFESCSPENKEAQISFAKRIWNLETPVVFKKGQLIGGYIISEIIVNYDPNQISVKNTIVNAFFRTYKVLNSDTMEISEVSEDFLFKVKKAELIKAKKRSFAS